MDERRDCAVVDGLFLALRIPEPGVVEILHRCSSSRRPHSVGEVVAKLDISRHISTTGHPCAEFWREALGMAQRRDVLDADLDRTEAQLARLPAVTAADPQPETATRLVNWATFGVINITANDINLARVTSMMPANCWPRLVAGDDAVAIWREECSALKVAAVAHARRASPNQGCRQANSWPVVRKTMAKSVRSNRGGQD
jgi:hypothetical protein